MNRTTDLLAKITTFYSWILWILYLFFCSENGYQGIVGGKYAMFLVICGGYILIMGLLGIECILIGKAKVPSLAGLWNKSSWTQRFSLAYLNLTWISALASPYLPETIVGVSRYEGALTITIYVLSFLLVSRFGRATADLLVVLCLSTTLFGVLCILQLAGGNPFRLYPPGYGYQDAYVAYPGAYLGTIGNVDLVAAFLCVTIPILWVGLVRLRGPMQALTLVPLAISVFVLLDMWVLAGLVGVFGGGILMLPVVLPLPPRRRRALAGALLLAVVLCVVLVYAVDLGPGPLHELHAILHGDWNGTFGSGRLHIWRCVLERAPRQIWLGTGPDTMLYAELEPFTRHDVYGALIVSRIDVAHNEYLNILFHQGVFALAAYVLTLYSAARSWIRTSGKDPVCAMLGGGALCYCVQAFFGFSMCITAPYFWLVLGLLESRAANQNEERELCGKS